MLFYKTETTILRKLSEWQHTRAMTKNGQGHLTCILDRRYICLNIEEHRKAKAIWSLFYKFEKVLKNSHHPELRGQVKVLCTILCLG